MLIESLDNYAYIVLGGRRRQHLTMAIVHRMLQIICVSNPVSEYIIENFCHHLYDIYIETCTIILVVSLPIDGMHVQYVIFRVQNAAYVGNIY